jgi:hypothetical protein
VAAVRGRTLAALDLRGRVRWSVQRPFALGQPVWAPDGLTIAYRSGDGLRAVAADGTEDRFLAGPMGAAAPAWLDERTLVWADRQGRVRTVDVITRREGWRSRAGTAPRTIVVASNRVLAVSDGAVRVLLRRDGRLALLRAAPRAETFVGAAAHGKRLALVRYDARHGLSHIELASATTAGADGRETPSLPGRVGAPTFSPDGRWLLLGWRVADEWLFLSTPTAGRVAAVGSVGKRLAPISPGRWAFPRVIGWAPASN